MTILSTANLRRAKLGGIGDDGSPHGLSLQTRTSGVEPDELWASQIQVGPTRAEYDIPALAAGPYLLICPVHPNMQVELNVG